MPISDNYGAISKCPVCTNPDVPEHCRNCQCRGFVAVCLACSGTGQLTVPVAGASSGDMKSTDPACGGTGKFAVKKPADWDAEHAEPTEEIKVEAESEEDAEFEAMTAGAKEGSVSLAELQDIASRLSAVPDAIIPDDMAKEIFESTISLITGGISETVEDEPKDDVELEAHTDPVRPKSIHWKKWAKFSADEKIAAVEAAKVETPELASV